MPTPQAGGLLTLRLSRSRMLRILGITPGRLLYWEKAGLIPERIAYEASELAALRHLSALSRAKIRASAIRAGLNQLRKLGVEGTLALIHLAPDPKRRRVIIRRAGQVVEPLSGQMRLAFTQAKPADIVPFALPAAQRAAEAEMWFTYAVSLEDNPGDRTAAAAAYLKCLEYDPGFASAYINLGTLRYHQGNFSEAERCYRQALALQPDYALACFDLGNVLDETGRTPQAIAAYAEAVRLSPGYADAHYNLALALEKSGLRRRALRHWRRYVQIENHGPWAEHARKQIQRSMQKERLLLVR